MFTKNKTKQWLKWGVTYPRLIVIFFLLGVLALTSGLPKLAIDNDFRVYFSDDNPQLQAFENFEKDYVSSDSATFVVTAKNGDLFTQQGLSLIALLTERAWLLDYAVRVESPTNFTVTKAYLSEAADDTSEVDTSEVDTSEVDASETEDIIESFPLLEDSSILDDTEVSRIKTLALSQPRLLKSTLASDLKTAIIFINLNLPAQDNNGSLKITRQMEKIQTELAPLYKNYSIQVGGSTAFNSTLARAVAKDLKTLVPISYLLIFIGLFVFLRRLSALVAIFVLITSCLVATFGIFGWLSSQLTPMAGFAPSVLLSIMVADSVHILTSYHQFLLSSKTKASAIVAALEVNWLPVLITSLTTMLGFLSLNFSASPPYQDLGNMVALGVFMALLFSLFFLPAMLILLPTPKGSIKANNGFGLLATQVIRHKGKLLILVSSICLGLLVFIPNNRISDNWANYFNDSFDITRLVNRLDGYMGGINSLEYSLKPQANSSIFSPEYLQQIDAFELWFLQQNKVVKVTSLSELMKELNQLMHQDDPLQYRIPSSEELAAQYLLFYEMGLPQGLGLNNRVTLTKAASRFSVSVTNAGSDELLVLDRLAQQWLVNNAPAIQASQATGLGMVFAHIAERNISDLLKGTLLALLLISLVMAWVFKSVKYGLLSLLPNIIPAAMAYGFWGLTQGFVDIALSIVACATLGIVVDDSVHFMVKYIAAKRQGASSQDALTLAFERVGLALVTTTAVLAGGFLILAVSPMNTSANIGVLMAVTLVFALIVDLFLLPPLLLLFDSELKGDVKKLL